MESKLIKKDSEVYYFPSTGLVLCTVKQIGRAKKDGAYAKHEGLIRVEGETVLGSNYFVSWVNPKECLLKSDKQAIEWIEKNKYRGYIETYYKAEDCGNCGKFSNMDCEDKEEIRDNLHSKGWRVIDFKNKILAKKYDCMDMLVCPECIEEEGF